MTISDTVLEFYKNMPFNLRETPKAQAAAVRAIDVGAQYPPLAPILDGASAIEIGCGVGWLSNSIAFGSDCRIVGIDFNPIAIERARAVARILFNPTAIERARFKCADLFEYSPAAPVDLVVSIGALHTTPDCMAAVRRIAAFVKPGGHIFLGLYHVYGRRPFLDHFAAMTAAGAGDDDLFAEFRRLRKMADPLQARSWYLDQVRHPHETLHTLAEVDATLSPLGFRLKSTSTNRFGPVDDPPGLFAAEKELAAVGAERLRQGVFYPGFFVCLYKNNG